MSKTGTTRCHTRKSAASTWRGWKTNQEQAKQNKEDNTMSKFLDLLRSEEEIN